MVGKPSPANADGVVRVVRSYVEFSVLGPPMFALVVLEIDPQFLKRGGGQLVEQVEAEPELALHVAKTQPVFDPGAVEILALGEVATSLEDRPAPAVHCLVAEDADGGLGMLHEREHPPDAGAGVARVQQVSAVSRTFQALLVLLHSFPQLGHRLTHILKPEVYRRG